MSNAIAWTLLHSLWEGALAAILAGGILLGTRASSPRLRYNLLLVVFFGLLAGISITFNLECRHTKPIPYTTFSATGVWGRIRTMGEPGAVPAPVVNTVEEDPLAGVEHFCDAYSGWIVLAWMIVLVIRLTQTGVSLGYVRRLRRVDTHPVPKDWEARIAELAHNLRISRSVRLLESGLISAPMVIGYLKPIVLVPLGVLAQLPPDQLEAVLLHELAHIRRGDYLVNLIQGLVEALLFFNPAVWWLSSLIREERENCCDDVAIRATRSKSQLINALVAFQEYRPVTYALAFPGPRYPLLNRVKRIVYNRNKTLNAMEKILLGACLLIGGSLTLALAPIGGSKPFYQTVLSRDTAPPVPPAPPAPPAPAVAPAPAAPAVPAVPAAPAMAPGPISPAVAPTPPAAAPEPPAIAAMEAVPATPAAPASPAIAATPAIPAIPDTALPLASNELQGGTFEGSLQIDNHKIVYARGIWTKDNIVRYYTTHYRIELVDGKITSINKDGQQLDVEANRQLAESLIDDLKAEADQHKDEAKRESQARSSGDRTVGVSGNGGSGSGVSGSGNVTAIGYSETTNSSGGDAVTITGKGSTANLSYVSSTRATTNSIEAVLDDIIDQNLVSDPKELSFTLDNDHMEINGERQPDKVFQSFKKKYIHNKHDSYVYSRHGDHSNTSVSTSNE